jgi:hypothetical protein
MFKVGQDRIYTPYMTVYLVISLPKIPYIHRIYVVLANPIYVAGLGRVAWSQLHHVFCPGFDPDL